MMKQKIVIVGAGLSGLYAAHRLSEAGREVIVIDARSRTGGRILSESAGDAAFDMGPTWYWPQWNPRMSSLLKELGIASFPQPQQGNAVFELRTRQVQQMKQGAQGEGMSWRVRGGMGMIVSRLLASQCNVTLHLATRLTHVRQLEAGGVELTVERDGVQSRISASDVINTIPPRLLAQTVQADPPWPAATLQAWQRSPTWMAPHAKFIACYDQPFWREAGFSGDAMSEIGPLGEIHDASDRAYALFGFVGLQAAQRAKFDQDQITRLALQQLSGLFGLPALAPMATFYKDWAADSLTATAADAAPLRVHPLYRRIDPPDAWANCFWMAGTESAKEHGGFLEGALEAAEYAVERILTR